MKFNYKFANLLGTVYRHGNIEFSSDGNTVICVVGNKLSLYDLKNSSSYTLPIEARYNYDTFAISPNGTTVIAAVDGGELQVIKMNSKQVMYSKKFNKTIKAIKFSPNGKYFAITKDNCVFIYDTPTSQSREYSPFNIKKYFKSAHDDTTCIDWLDDSSAIVFGSIDMSVHVCGIHKYANLKDVTVAGNTDKIIGVYFVQKSLDVIVVTRDGQISIFESSLDREQLILEEDVKKTIEYIKKSREEEEDEPEFKIEPEEVDEDDMTHKRFLKMKTKDVKRELSKQIHYKRILRFNVKKHMKDHSNLAVSASTYFKEHDRLAVGLSSGEFMILDMSDKGEVIQNIKIQNKDPYPITSLSFNNTGDWLAIGVSQVGQLAVWEWKSETFILKQQGHFNNIRVVAHSPDGINIATGGEDGKVKLWSMQSSFCFMTRDEHKAAVTGIQFTQSGKAVITASLDGTVRAFDLMRYRNFKTLTANKPAQFGCLTVDSSGELIAAGGQDTNEIFLWSLKTGKLLEVLAGHSAPVVSLKFSPLVGSTMMISTAWDKTVKIWDAIESSFQKETIDIFANGLCVAFRRDGKQIAVATLDGHITLFDPFSCKQEGCIEGRDDLEAGRADTDMITAKSNQKSKAFTTIHYSSDGSCILAGGQSKVVCLYNLSTLLLVKRFEITQNRSFDAMDEIVDRKRMAEQGINLSLIEDRDDKNMKAIPLPGVRRGDNSTRAFRPEVRVHDISFSTGGRSWGACTTEGLLIYSLDSGTWLFDPLDIEEKITPVAIRHTLHKEQYGLALMMAIRLNIDTVTQEVLETIPHNEISVIAGTLKEIYVEPLLKIAAKLIGVSNHIELYSMWISEILSSNWKTLKSRSTLVTPILNDVYKSVATYSAQFNKLCQHALSVQEFYLLQNKLKRNQVTNEEVEDIF